MIKDSRDLVKKLASYTIPQAYLSPALPSIPRKAGFLEGLLGGLSLKGRSYGTGVNIGWGQKKPPADLYEAMSQVEPSFAEVLFELIEKSGYQKDSTIYKRAGLSKSAFSRIRSGRLPKRENILRLALVLLLSMEDTERLLHAAGYSFQANNKFDLFVAFFLEEHAAGRDYDYDLLNMWCYEVVGEPLMGEK